MFWGMTFLPSLVKVKMMQRSSGTMARNFLIGSVCVILLLVVLYYMKRVEVGKLRHDMDDMLVSWGE